MASAVAMVVGAGGAGKEGERERIVGRVSRKRSSRHSVNGHDRSEPCADVDGIGTTRQTSVRRRVDHNPNESAATAAGSLSSTVWGSTPDHLEPETSFKGSAAAAAAVAATTETRTNSGVDGGGDHHHEDTPVEQSPRRSERLPARSRQAPQRLEPLSREEEVWLLLIRGIIGLPIGALVIGVAAILFGAPVSIDSLWKTATWSIFMSTLIVLPTACCKGASWDDWIRLFAQTRPLGAVEILLCIPAHGAAIGAWIGAWPMPLDWAQPWQEWPVCCTYGSVAGYVVGLLLSLGFIVTHKPEQFWHLKKL